MFSRLHQNVQNMNVTNFPAFAPLASLTATEILYHHCQRLAKAVRSGEALVLFETGRPRVSHSLAHWTIRRGKPKAAHMPEVGEPLKPQRPGGGLVLRLCPAGAVECRSGTTPAQFRWSGAATCRVDEMGEGCEGPRWARSSGRGMNSYTPHMKKDIQFRQRVKQNSQSNSTPFHIIPPPVSQASSGAPPRLPTSEPATAATSTARDERGERGVPRGRAPKGASEMERMLSVSPDGLAVPGMAPWMYARIAECAPEVSPSPVPSPIVI